MSIIKLENISKKFVYGKSGVISVLDNVNLEIEKGDFISLMGPSGAGKTTLFNIIGCVYEPDEGKYIFENEDISKINPNICAKIRNEKIGFLRQDYALINELTVYENIMLPLLFSKLPKKSFRTKAENAAEMTGISDLLNQKAGNLSGGQKQRTAAARAIVNDPSLILADEPTGALDSENAMELMNLFESLNKNGSTIFIVTHDKNVAERSKRILHIKDGKISA